jgi:hypothetical protein
MPTVLEPYRYTETETEKNTEKKTKEKTERTAFASLQRALSRLCFSRIFDRMKIPAFCRWKGRKGFRKKSGGNGSADPASAFAL